MEKINPSISHTNAQIINNDSLDAILYIRYASIVINYAVNYFKKKKNCKICRENF